MRLAETVLGLVVQAGNCIHAFSSACPTTSQHDCNTLNMMFQSQERQSNCSVPAANGAASAARFTWLGGLGENTRS
jgi:hypothetical protein